MFVTSISLSYAFLGISIITLLFFLYFKVLVVRTSPDNSHREAIIGNMNSPEAWRSTNNKMAYMSLFWSVLSIGIFIYMKYFFTEGVVSIVIPFIYVGLIFISASYMSRKKKITAH